MGRYLIFEAALRYKDLMLCVQIFMGNGSNPSKVAGIMMLKTVSHDHMEIKTNRKYAIQTCIFYHEILMVSLGKENIIQPIVSFEEFED